MHCKQHYVYIVVVNLESSTKFISNDANKIQQNFIELKFEKHYRVSLQVLNQWTANYYFQPILIIFWNTIFFVLQDLCMKF